MLAGYPVMGGAIAVLWRAYHKSQEERVKMATENEKVLGAIKAMLEEKVT
jgi:hypothetical protein